MHNRSTQHSTIFKQSWTPVQKMPVVADPVA